MIRKLPRSFHQTLLVLATLLASGSAYAYNIEVRSDNPAISDAELRSMTQTAGDAVRVSIPDNRDVYVSVLTRSKPRVNNPTAFVYYHRVQLLQHFNATAPYAVNGWLPIKSTENYGVDNESGVKLSLEATLREFFTTVKTLNVAPAAPSAR